MSQDQSVNITINAGGDAAKYLNELLQASDKIVHTQKAMRAGAGHGGMSGGGMAGGPQGAAGAMSRGAGELTSILSSSGSMGAVASLSKLGAYGAAAAAALYAFDAGLVKGAKALTVKNDATQTAAQKLNALGDELVPFHRSIREFTEAFDGTANKMRETQDKFDVQMATMATQQSRYGPTAGAAFGAAQANNYRDAVSAFTPAGYQRFDQSTVQGRIAGQAQSALLPAQDAATAAGRNQSAAQRDTATAWERANDAAKDYNRTVNDLNAATTRLKEIEDRENKTGIRNKAERFEAAQAVVTQLQKQADMEQRLGAERQRYAQAQQAQSAAATQAARAHVGVMQAELGVLQQQEQRMSAMRQNLGSMNRGEVAYSSAVLRMIAKRGVDNLPPEMQAQAARLAPEFVRAEQEKLGERRAQQFRGSFSSEEYARIFGDAEAGGATLEATRNKIQKVAADMRVVVELDTKRVAEDLANIMRGEWAGILEGAKIAERNAGRMVEAKKAAERAQQN